MKNNKKGGKNKMKISTLALVGLLGIVCMGIGAGPLDQSPFLGPTIFWAGFLISLVFVCLGFIGSIKEEKRNREREEAWAQR